MLLTTTKLSVVRRDATPIILPDISLSQDSHLLLLGPSGSGKTTFLSVIAGLLEPTSGQAFLDGKDLYALTPSQRDALRGKTLGFVFQNLHLLGGLTLRQNIILAASMADKEVDEAYFSQLLHRLGLSDKIHRKPHELSIGEQQRVAIARALINKPQILIADEPTSALDDDNASAVIDLIQAQAREVKAALLIATHDKRVVDRFDTVIHLQNGKAKVAA